MTLKVKRVAFMLLSYCLVNKKNFQIFISNYNFDLSSYVQCLSLFYLGTQVISHNKKNNGKFLLIHSFSLFKVIYVHTLDMINIDRQLIWFWSHKIT